MRTLLETSVLALTGLALVAAPATATAQGGGADDPPFSVPVEDLEAALDCTEFTNPDKEPLLLVHGTGTHGHEQYDWNWALLLPELGFDFCLVTYPDRGMGDQQVSAEYVAWAVQQIHARSGRMVDIAGHSQGASMPRWALRWWPSVRAVVDDFIGIAGPYHGTSVVGDFGGPPTGMPAAFWQFAPGSEFNRVLNEGDETYGDISWTNIYTLTDELVQPVDPVPTAALDFGQDNPLVTNVLIQDHCPLRVVDHASIGLTDRLVFDMTLAAATADGPLDLTSMDLGPACNVAEQIGEPGGLATIGPLVLGLLAGGPPDFHTTNGEPPLMPYATGDAPISTEAASAPRDVPADAGAPAPTLPNTGGGLLVLGGLTVAGSAAVARRRG